MIVPVLAIAVAALIGFAIGPDSYAAPFRARARTGTAAAVFITVIWAVIALVVSPYMTSTCRSLADGYGLEQSDWSFRHGCRVQLPGGQWVPEERIRVTTAGEITGGG